MLKKIELPYVFERMIAFSIPENGIIYVISYEGLHIINLFPEISVETKPEHAEDYTIFDVDKMILNFNNQAIPMLGLHGGNPLVTSPDGHTLKLIPEVQLLNIENTDLDIVQSIEYSDFSGDWAISVNRIF